MRAILMPSFMESDMIQVVIADPVAIQHILQRRIYDYRVSLKLSS
jgi:hypothetical protein